MKKIITLIAVVTSLGCYAQEDLKDHKLVGRYQDSWTTSHRIVEKGKLNYALSPKRDGHWSVLKQVGAIEGKITVIEYEAPIGATLDHVTGYYNAMLKNRGFKFLFSCKGDDCKDDAYPVGQTLSEGDYIAHLSRNIWRGLFEKSSYIVAQKKSIDYITTATLLASVEEGRSVCYRLEIADTENLDLPIKDIEASINNSGKLPLYNIYFDDQEKTSIIQPKSQKIISALAKYLKANPELSVLVVGHTDNSAEFEDNFTRSQIRAEAVVNELIEKYQISPLRITPHGVGSLSPVTTNSNASGRRLNNRIEIVKR